MRKIELIQGETYREVISIVGLVPDRIEITWKDSFERILKKWTLADGITDLGGGNATIGTDGRAYFAFRTSIGKAPTSNMLEVAGKGNFDGGLQLDQRVDIDGFQIGGSLNENVSMTVFKNWDGTNMGAVGDFNMNDRFLDIHGYKGVGITVKTPAANKRAVEIDTISQVKIISGKTGIAQALTINNDSTLATAGRGSELKFTATGDTTLASIQVVTQTTNNKVGLMKFLTNNGTANAVRMTIDQSGNVGIADDTPSYKLDITGDLRTTGSAYVGSTSGRMGIGTVSPDQKLHVFGGGDTRIKLGNETSQWSWAVGQAGAGNLSLVEEGIAVRLLVEASTGRVAIGTTSPTSQFQVVGLPEHADNAAAVTAGLTVGAFYRTGDLLKVVH